MALLLMLLLSANLAMALSSLPGGPEDVNIHDKDVMEALDMAVSQYNKQDNSVFLSKVTDVIRAQKQIVAGIKYIFSVKMAYTVCRKTAVKKRCAINRNKKLAKPFICDFEVWSQPWLNKSSVVKSSCKN